MLKNYPSTSLFILSVVVFLGISLIQPIVGPWHVSCSITLEVLRFTASVTCGFFFFCAVIENAHNMFFRNRHH